MSFDENSIETAIAEIRQLAKLNGMKRPVVLLVLEDGEYAQTIYENIVDRSVPAISAEIDERAFLLSVPVAREVLLDLCCPGGDYLACKVLRVTVGIAVLIVREEQMLFLRAKRGKLGRLTEVTYEGTHVEQEPSKASETAKEAKEIFGSIVGLLLGYDWGADSDPEYDDAA